MRKVSMKKIVEVNKSDNELSTFKKSLGTWNILFIILLFPFYISKILSDNKKLEPFMDKLQKKTKYLDELKSELHKAEWTLREEKDKLKELTSKNNIMRLNSRFKIEFGLRGNSIYYFRFKHQGRYYYKIGITKRSAYARYNSPMEGGPRLDFDELYFDVNIRRAEELERIILAAFKDDLANDPQILKQHGGYTEVFKRNVLEL